MPNLDHLLQRNDIWRGGEQARHAPESALASGNPELDAQLPGGGWPLGALTELLLDHHGIGELQLLMPALARLSREEKRWLAWVAPPFRPYAPALAAMGVNLAHVLCIYPRDAKESLWAMEQALRSGTCGAVLGWLGALDTRSLRRLQLAAEAGNAMGLLFRPARHAAQPSPAALRLQLSPAHGGTAVHILKRRGGWSRQPVYFHRYHAVA